MCTWSIHQTLVIQRRALSEDSGIPGEVWWVYPRGLPESLV